MFDSFISLLFFSFFLMFLIPSVSTRTIYPLISSILHYCLSKYLLPDISLKYDVWDGILTIYSIILSPSLCTWIEDLLPLPVKITTIRISKIQIQISLWQLMYRIYQLQKSRTKILPKNEYEAIHIKANGIQIEFDMVDQLVYALDEEKMIQILLEKKKVLIEYVITTMEKGLATYGRPQEQPSWIYYVIQDTVRRLHITLNDLSAKLNSVNFHFSKTANEIIALSVPSVTLTSENDDNDHKNDFKIDINTITLNIGEDQCIELKNFLVDVIVPDIADLLASLQHIGSPNSIFKKIYAAVKLDKMKCSISPEMVECATLHYIMVSKYLSFIQFTEHKMEANYQTQLSFEEKKGYVTALQTSTSGTYAGENLLKLSRNFKLEMVYEIYAEALNWKNRWDAACQRANWNTSNLKSMHDVVEHLQAYALPINSVDLSFSISNLKFDFVEDEECKGSMVFAQLDGSFDKLLLQPLTESFYSQENMHMKVSLKECFLSSCLRFQVVENPSILLSGAPCTKQKPLVQADITQSLDGALSVKSSLYGLTILALCDQIQDLILLFDRMEALYKENMDAARENDAYVMKTMHTTSSPGPMMSHVAAHCDTLIHETDTVAFFVPNIMNIQLEIEDVTLCCAYKATEDRLLDMLALETTLYLSITSSHKGEEVVIEVRQIFLRPWAVDMEEWNSTKRPWSTFTCDSILSPFHCIADYHLSIIPSNTKTRWVQHLSIELSDTALCFSELQLALLIHNLGLFSKFHITTPSQMESRKLQRAEANKAEFESQSRLKTALMRKAIQPMLDADGLVRSELLHQVIQKMDYGKTLLLSELGQLERSLLDAIDHSPSSATTLDNLLLHLTNMMQYDSLHGSLNLKAYMYNSTAYIKRWGEISSHGEFVDIHSCDNFWRTFNDEARLTGYTINDSHSKTTQRKLVRFVGNYIVAKNLWESKARSVSNESKDLPWLINPEELCDGLGAFNHPTEFILMQEKDRFENDEDLTQDHNQPANPVSWELTLNTTLGDIAFRTFDNALPFGVYRSVASLQKIKLEANLSSEYFHSLLDILHPMVTWDLLFSFELGAWVFADRARHLEPIIEPWNVHCGMFGKADEYGYTILAETEERLQINVTDSLLSYASSLISHMDEKFLENDIDSLRSKSVRLNGSHANVYQITIRNASDIDLFCQFADGVKKEMGSNKSTIVSSDEQLPKSFAIGQKEWGVLEDVSLDRSFAIEILIPNAQDRGKALPLRLLVSKMDNRRTTVMIGSNTYIRNSTSSGIEVRTIVTENNGLQNDSNIIYVAPRQRVRLSPSIFMGTTEICMRLEGHIEWLTKISVGSYLIDLENRTATQVRRHSSKKAVTTNEPSEEFGDTFESQNVVKRFNAYFFLSRRRIPLHAPEWEFHFLPKLIIHNALPYPIDTSLIEYRPQMTASGAISIGESSKIESILCSYSAKLEDSTEYMHRDRIMSGKTMEIVDALGLKPLFFCVRLYNEKEDSYSPWSHAIQDSWENMSHEDFKKPQSSQQIILPNGLRILMEKEIKIDTPRIIRFSVPYWIMNHTGIQLSYSTSTLPSATQPMIISTNHFCDPSLIFLEKASVSIRPEKPKTISPDSWSKVGNQFSDIVPPKSKFESGTWSSSINVEAVNTHGEVSCGEMVFGISIHRMTTLPQHPTVTAMRILPRYVIKNDTWHQLYMIPIITARDKPNAFQFSDVLWVDSSTVQPGTNKAFYAFNDLTGNPDTKKTLSSDEYARQLLLGSEKDVHEQRYEDDALSWSYPIPIDNVGDFYCRVCHSFTGSVIVLHVHIETKEETIYVIIQESSSEPPYKIENYTQHEVRFRLQEEETMRILQPASWCSLVWEQPSVAQHLIEVQIGDLPMQVYDLDRIGVQAELSSDEQLFTDSLHEQYQVHVYPLRHARILQIFSPSENIITPITSVMTAKDANTDKEKKRGSMKLSGNSKHYLAAYINVHFLGLGISLYDAKPREILFLSVDSITFKKLSNSLRWSFSVFHVQLDNMLRGTKFPVIINPEDSGYSSRVSNNGTLLTQPFFAIEAESSKGDMIKVYENYEILLSPFSVKLDIEFLYKTACLLDKYVLQPYEEAVLEILDRDKVEKVLVNPFIHSSNMVVPEQQLYFEKFRVHSTEIRLEWSLRRGDLMSKAAKSKPMQYVLALVGLLGSNLSGSPSIYFGDIVVSQCFVSIDKLANILQENYSRQAIWQAYKILGSSNIIGDPLNLVGNLGTGVVEFFRMTKDEMFGEAATRGEGVKFLGKTIVHTGASTAAKITGSLDRFVGELNSLTAASGSSEQSGVSPPKSSGSSSNPLVAPVGFVKKLGQEITGIVTKPVEGVQKGGIGGLVQGTVQGVLGPGVVMLKALTATSHSLVSHVEGKMVDRGPYNGRRRERKVFRDGLLISDNEIRRCQPNTMTIQVINAKDLRLSNSGTSALCCNVYIDNIQVLHTRVMHSSNNPSWNEEKTLLIKPEYAEIKFEVCDSIAGVSMPIGIYKILLDDILKENKKKELQSTLCNWVKYGPPSNMNDNIHILELSDMMVEKNFVLYRPEMYELGYNQYDMGYVYIHVISAKQLSRSGGFMDMLKTSTQIDSYVSVLIGNLRHNTPIVKGTNNPKWDDQKFILPFESHTSPQEDTVLPLLEFRVYDANLMGDERLGTSLLPLEERNGKEYDLVLHSNSNNDTRGLLKVYVKALTHDEAEQMSEYFILKAGDLHVAFDFS